MRNTIFPFIISLFISLLLLSYNISSHYTDFSFLVLDFNLKGFEKVIDGIITFTSIIIGFLVAILTILLSSKDSKIINRIMDGSEKEELRIYFLSSFIIGGFLVFNSIIMYVARHFTNILTYILFYSWFFFTVFFTVHLILFLNIIMKLLFHLNEDSNHERQEDNIL